MDVSGSEMEDVAAGEVDGGVRGGGKKKGKARGSGAVRKQHNERRRKERQVQESHGKMWRAVMPGGWRG